MLRPLYDPTGSNPKAPEMGKALDSRTLLILGCRGLLGMDCVEVFGGWGRVVCFGRGELDICDVGRVRGVLAEVRPDVVVNCAAFTDVDGCEGNRELAYLVNGEAVGGLALVAREIGARLVHISTDYVFRGDREVPWGYSEDDLPDPLSVYGKSKLEGERLVMEASPDHLVVRTGWLYGRHGRSFPKAILRQALLGRPLKVVSDQYGSPTWSMSLARQIEVLVREGVGGVVHVTSHGWCSWYEFAKRILELLEIPVELSPCTSSEYPRPAMRPKNSILEKRRLKALGLDRMNHWEVDLRGFVSAHGKALVEELKGEILG